MENKENFSTSKGLPAKILLILGVLIVLLVVIFIGFGRGIFPNWPEYKKDQAHLAAAMKTKLPVEPLPEIKYSVKGYRIPGIGGFCWLESSSGLVKYLEPDIDFDKFVFYGRPTLVMAGRDKNERWGPGLNQIHAFSELGYTAFIGSTNPTHFPQNVYPDVDLRNMIYFKIPEEELDLMKKLISASVMPTINYAGDFSTVAGYNKDGLWIVKSDPSQTDKEGTSFMTPPVPFEPIYVTYQDFFKNWKIYHQFFWFEKTGQRKPESEIYAKNKKNAQEAPQNMRAVIDYLEKGGNLIHYTFELDIPSSVALYRYFTGRGNLELANTYLELAEIYESQRLSLDPNLGPDAKTIGREFIIETLTKALPLYEKAATMWP